MSLWITVLIAALLVLGLFLSIFTSPPKADR